MMMMMMIYLSIKTINTVTAHLMF